MDWKGFRDAFLWFTELNELLSIGTHVVAVFMFIQGAGQQGKNTFSNMLPLVIYATMQ